VCRSAGSRGKIGRRGELPGQKREEEIRMSMGKKKRAIAKS
jgi:hypothetical protein